MGLSAADIAAVIQEVGPALRGGWIQKVFQPTPHSIVLEVRTPGQTLPLLLSADPDTARLHLVSRKLPNPPSPPPFCQFLRAHVQGARVDAVTQVPGDRIVRISLTSREGPCTLVAELTGRHADLLWLDGSEKVLAALHNDRDRVGHRYHPPAQRPQAPRGPVEAWPTPNTDQPFPLSALLEEQYRQQETDSSAERLRQTRLTDLRKTIKKAVRRIDALQDDLAKAERYKDYARYGELLKANLGTIKKGHERVTVVDYFDPAQPELIIPLDPSKTPQGNMDDYFKKHRKYLTAGQEIAPRIAQIERELDALRTELTAIEQGTWEPPAEQAPARAGRARPLTPHASPLTLRPFEGLRVPVESLWVERPSGVEGQAQSPRREPLGRTTEPSRGTPHAKRSGPFRRFTSADGLPIYVGRNAKENEELTLKFARSDDLWLHAQGVPGSHVVVRLEKGASPPPETLKDAAALALLYSDLKKSGKGDVIYTKRKYVRKVKGRSPGTVTVTQEKSIFVQLDRARLDRLKQPPA